MLFTRQQVAHFDTFGYLVVRQLFNPEEMALITEEFEDQIQDGLNGHEFTGEKRLAVSSFIERRPKLWHLLEDDRIYQRVEDLLGPDFMWRGSGANLYVGNTEWHRDAADLELGFTRLNLVFNLDPVDRDSGCLRLVPGSHHGPFHDRLRPLNYWRKVQVAGEGRIPKQDVIDFANEFDISEDDPLFGVDPRDVPSVAVASEPGDVVFFNMYCYHATFGGRTGRRMFAMNFTVNPATDAQVALLRRQLEIGRSNQKVMQHGATGEIYPRAFLECDRPRIKRMVGRLNELGLK